MQRSALVWGSILVLMGALLLLSRLGLLTFSLWAVFWPLALIIVGLSFLFGSRREPSPQAKEEATVRHLVMQLKGADSAEIAIAFGAGRLAIDGSAPPDELLTGSFGGGAEYEAHDLGDGRVHLDLRLPTESGGRWRENDWRLALNPDLPLALQLDTGASDNTLDLAAMQVGALTVRAGASQTNIILPTAAVHTRVDIEGGAAAVMVTVPEGVAARISGQTSVGQLAVDEARFPRAGSVFESPDFETAPNKVVIIARMGLGSVTIT